MNQENNVRLAINKVGSQAQIGRLLGVSRVAVTKWCANNQVPWEHLDAFCNVTKTHPKLVNEMAQKLFNRWK